MDKKAFTLIELLVVIVVVGLLASLVVPVLNKAVQLARRSACLSNMHHMGLAVLAYASENRLHYPPSSCASHENPAETWWINVLQPYSGTRLLYRCPSDEAGTFIDWSDPPLQSGWDRYRWASYSTNARFDVKRFRMLGGVPNPTDTVYACETPESVVGSDHVHPEMWFSRSAPENHVAHDRHLGESSYLFADGHAARMKLEETWEPGERNLWNPKKAPQWSGPMEY